MVTCQKKLPFEWISQFEFEELNMFLIVKIYHITLETVLAPMELVTVTK